MPRVDGIEVLKYIKVHFLDMPVIMVTRVGEVRIAVECMKLGAFHYLTKPYSAVDLQAVVDLALERRRLVLENKVLKSELASAAGRVQVGAAVSMSDIEKAHIHGVLTNVRWNKNAVAKILGISLKTLYTKIQQYNLSKD